MIDMNNPPLYMNMGDGKVAANQMYGKLQCSFRCMANRHGLRLEENE
jgi:hypothetical protein